MQQLRLSNFIFNSAMSAAAGRTPWTVRGEIDDLVGDEGGKKVCLNA